MTNEPCGGRIFFEREAAIFLTNELKLPIKVATLALKRRIGGGPKYRRVLGRVEYDEAALREWVARLRATSFTATAQESRLGGPRKRVAA